MRKLVILGLVVLLAFALAVIAARGKWHVKGTISMAGSDHLLVKDLDGREVRVAITNKTKFFKGKAPATSADVRVGSRVAVHLDENGNAASVKLSEDNPKP
jgi:ABC-type transporter Mla subunit MlaD